MMESVANILDWLRESVVRKQFLLGCMFLSWSNVLLCAKCVVTMEIDENRHRVLGIKLSTNLLYKNRT